jgi:hypothetical protein
MGDPTLDRRFHRRQKTNELTVKKVLLLMALVLGMACSLAVADQLQRFVAAQSGDATR